MLTDIDAALAEHAQAVTEVTQLGEQYLAEALASVTDLIDNSVGGDSCACHYAPSLAGRLPRQRSVIDYDASRFAQELTGVHPVSSCAGQICIMHRPTRHHMSGWPLIWRDDTKTFERICVCGVGHPDPDQIEYWSRRRLMYRSLHPCDGCCMP